MNILETITVLITPPLALAVRKMRISEEKCPNAMRYVNMAMS